MIDLKSFKRELRDLLTEGIDLPINRIKEQLPEQTEKYESIILFESQLKELERQELRGTISENSLALRRNQLRQSLIDFIADLEERDFLQTKEPAISKRAKAQSNQRKFLMVGIPALLLLTLLFFFFRRENVPNDNLTDNATDDTSAGCDSTFLQEGSANLSDALVYLILNADSSLGLCLEAGQLQWRSTSLLRNNPAAFYWKIEQKQPGIFYLNHYTQNIRLSTDSTGLTFLPDISIDPENEWKIVRSDQGGYHLFAVASEKCLRPPLDSNATDTLICCGSFPEDSALIALKSFIDPGFEYAIRSKKDSNMLLRNKNSNHIRLTQINDRVPLDRRWIMSIADWRGLNPVWKIISRKDSSRLIRVAINTDMDYDKMNVLPKERDEGILHDRQKEWLLVEDQLDPNFFLLQSCYRFGGNDFYLEIKEWKPGRRELRVQVVNNYIKGDLLKLWELIPVIE